MKWLVVSPHVVSMAVDITPARFTMIMISQVDPYTGAKWFQDISSHYVLAKAQPRHAAKTQQWKRSLGETSQPQLSATQWLTCKLQIISNGACNGWTYNTLNSNSAWHWHDDPKHAYMAQLQKHVWHLTFFVAICSKAESVGCFNHVLALKKHRSHCIRVSRNFDFWMQHVLLHFPLQMQHVILIVVHV